MDQEDINFEDFPDGLPDEVMDQFRPMKKLRRECLVEDCFVLSLSDLGKGLLRGCGETDESAPIGSEVKKQGKQGEVVLVSRRGKLPLQYSVDLEEPIMVNVSCKHRNSWLNQAIYLDEASISYGIRPYLRCPCGYRANKLYLAPQSYSFQCRHCAGLYYESTSINRNSTVGGLAYLLTRHLKLIELRAKVKRVVYAGQVTRKARQVVKMAAKYGIR